LNSWTLRLLGQKEAFLASELPHSDDIWIWNGGRLILAMSQLCFCGFFYTGRLMNVDKHVGVLPCIALALGVFLPIAWVPSMWMGVVEGNQKLVWLAGCEEMGSAARCWRQGPG